MSNTKKITELPLVDRKQVDHDRREEMVVEFIGGPFDGLRRDMHIVREPGGSFRVLEMRYMPALRTIAPMLKEELEVQHPEVPNPHHCRGCGNVVDAKRLDEHAKECSNPARLAQYRRNKSSAGKRSAHKRFHVGRGIMKPDCPLCARGIATTLT
jgi:hypothetical protein